MSQRSTPEEVRAEHLAEISQKGHWLYLIGVLVVGLIVMLGFIAWLAS